MNISAKHSKAIESLIPERERQAFVDLALERAIKDHKAAHADGVEVYVDGGSRGNPGPSGGGFAIYRGGKLVYKGSEFFGTRTNNQAEYLALRAALREVYDRFPDLKLHVYMDSQLAVEQMNHRYQVKSPNVRPIFDEVERIAAQFKHLSITHVPREQNKVADAMANEAMDRGR